MIIDSLNPPEYNGFKIMIAGKCIQVLYQRIQTQDFFTGHGTSTKVDIKPRKCLGWKTPFEVFTELIHKDYFLNQSVALMG